MTTEEIDDLETELAAVKGAVDPRLAILRDRQFNPNVKPPVSIPVYSIGDVSICTPGNLTAITAAAKAGKTAFLGVMMAATFTVDKNADCFGLVAANSEGKALLHFDTEQSIEDHWHLVDRAIRRSQAPSAPPWLFELSFRWYARNGSLGTGPIRNRFCD